MNIAQHHADWLRLVDVSGSFLSLPVLTRAMPSGLPPLEQGLGETFRLAHDEWFDGHDSDEADLLDEAWVEFVLTRVLDYDQESLRSGDDIDDALAHTQREHRETLRPNYAVIDPDSNGEPLARLLIQRWQHGQRLDAVPPNLEWAASPEERMAVLCRATGVRLGLVTNGSEWMLIDAPVGRGVTTATWYSSDWRSELLGLRAFIACLGVSRFFDAEDNTLEALLDDALTRQQEVTVQLGKV